MRLGQVGPGTEACQLEQTDENINMCKKERKKAKKR